MPIKAYVGLPRHGKTYEVVTEAIFNALRQGRRVVSNIAGLNRDAMLEEHVKRGGDPVQFGEIVTVSHDQPLKSSFWPSDTDRQSGVESFIKPGDFIALDEIWRFWQGFGLRDSDGNKRPDRVMNFFRTHGHFTDPVKGYCCDVALITQDIGDFHRSARAVIEEIYKMTKLTSLGSTSRYRVDIYPPGRMLKPMRQIQRSYNPDYFGFYKSHSQHVEGEAAPVEENPDKRGNLLKGALFRFVLPVGVFVFAYASYLVYSFLHPEPKTPVKTSSVAAVVPSHETRAEARQANDLTESEQWRAAGWISDENLRVIIHDGTSIRMIRPPKFQLIGNQVETFLPNGDAVTPWSGRGGHGLIDRAATQAQ